MHYHRWDERGGYYVHIHTFCLPFAFVFPVSFCCPLIAFAFSHVDNRVTSFVQYQIILFMEHTHTGLG